MLCCESTNDRGASTPGDPVAESRECEPVPLRLVIKAYLLVELASDKGGIYTADMMFRLAKLGPERK
jgi:hypothetical protein